MVGSSFRIFWVGWFFLVVGVTPGWGAALTQITAEQLRADLSRGEGPPRLSVGHEIVLDGDTLPVFYGERGFRPAWVDDLGIAPRALQLLETLRSVANEGLCPDDYPVSEIEELLLVVFDSQRFDLLLRPTDLARLDLLLTDTFLRLAADLRSGRAWRLIPGRQRRVVDGGQMLQKAIDRDDVAVALRAAAPPQAGYRRLKLALEEYRRMSGVGGWPTVPDGPVLHLGEQDDRVRLLRERLRLGGDLRAAVVAAADVFDPETEQALRRFQQRHGLTADGVLGEETLQALNVSVEGRVHQLELNLERWRWLPRDLGERYIEVNIADFSLKLVEHGQQVLSMPVVVGSAYRKTPSFSAKIVRLELAPYWTVPATILAEDKLPRLRLDPRQWLQDKHFEIVKVSGGVTTLVDPMDIDWSKVNAQNFPGALRQLPGPWNPLGRVKFLFPNPYDVYLHDTPDKQLFQQEQRTFSSGCIRVERPFELAEFLLRDQPDWTPAKIRQTSLATGPVPVVLSQPLPIHILYRTAWVEKDGQLQLRKDVYLQDFELELALAQASRPAAD